jgi:hypothetical protein
VIERADFAVALDDLAGRIACGQRLGRNLDRVVDDDAPRILGSALVRLLQDPGVECHQLSSFSRLSSKVMPSGSFLSSSLSCAPGGRRHLDRDFGDLRGRANAPAFELADQVQR